MMNAFFVETRDTMMIVEDVVEAGGAPCEIWHYGKECDIVFAETRGQARALFTQHYDLDFTDPVRIKLIASNVCAEAGILDPRDPLGEDLYASAAIYTGEA